MKKKKKYSRPALIIRYIKSGVSPELVCTRVRKTGRLLATYNRHPLKSKSCDAGEENENCYIRGIPLTFAGHRESKETANSRSCLLCLSPLPPALSPQVSLSAAVLIR